MFFGQIRQKFQSRWIDWSSWRGRWGVSVSQQSIHFIPSSSCKLALLAFLPVHFFNLSVLHLLRDHGNIHFAEIPPKSATQHTSLLSVFVSVGITVDALLYTESTAATEKYYLNDNSFSMGPHMQFAL